MAHKGGNTPAVRPPPGKGGGPGKAPDWWNAVGANLNKGSQDLRKASDGWMKNWQTQSTSWQKAWQKSAKDFKFHMPGTWADVADML